MASLPARAHLLAALALSLGTFANDARGQQPAIRTENTLLMRDVDGSGKSDYVVRESRPGPAPQMRDYRVAVYLDRTPGPSVPSWATEWLEELGGETILTRSELAGPGVWLLGIGASHADATEEWLLLVERGRLREEIHHQIDYGAGFLEVRRERNRLLVEATLSNLTLRGKVASTMKTCPDTLWLAVRLVFDAKERAFAPERAVCAPRRY